MPLARTFAVDLIMFLLVKFAKNNRAHWTVIELQYRHLFVFFNPRYITTEQRSADDTLIILWSYYKDVGC